MTRAFAALRANAGRFLFGASSAYLIAGLLGRIGTFVLIPSYARHLTLVEYGDYGLAQTAVVAAGPILSLGVPPAVTRFYFEGSDRRAAALRSGSAARVLALFVVGFSLIVSFVIAAMAPAHRGGFWDRRSLIDITVAATGEALAPLLFHYFRCRHQPFAAVGIQVLNLVSLSTIGIYLVAYRNLGLTGALDAMAAAGALTSAVSVAYVCLRVPGRLDIQVFKEAIRFGYPLLGKFYSAWVTGSADRWILKMTNHSEELGSYALACQLTNPTSLPTTAWAEAEYARVGQIRRDGGIDAVHAQLPSARRTFLWISMLPGPFLIAALPLIPLYVGQRAHVSPVVLILIAVSLILDAQYYPNYQVLFYTQTHLLNRVTVFSMVVTLLSLLVAIPYGGQLGAAIARAVSSAARMVFMVSVVRRSRGGDKSQQSG